MNIGDTIEAAIWLAGTETRELRERFEADVRDNIREACGMHGVVHGPVVFREKRPGDERVPPVPDHIQGPDVRLLVAEADIVAPMPVMEHGFVGDLEPKDLERLRAITRRRAGSYGRVLTDDECDDIIEEIGPDAAVDALRRASLN